MAVRAQGVHQPLRFTVFDDAAAIEHHDAIEGIQRRQSVRNGDHGTPFEKARQRLLNRLFGFRIEGGSRFIEQHDGCIHQEGARDRQTLPLAARQLHAAFADQSIEALRQAIDELGAARRFDGAEHFLVARLGAAVAQVFQQRTMEQ